MRPKRDQTQNADKTRGDMAATNSTRLSMLTKEITTTVRCHTLVHTVNSRLCSRGSSPARSRRGGDVWPVKYIGQFKTVVASWLASAHVPGKSASCTCTTPVSSSFSLVELCMNLSSSARQKLRREAGRSAETSETFAVNFILAHIRILG